MNNISLDKNNIVRIVIGLTGIIIVGLFFFIFSTARDIRNISNEIHQQRVELELQYQKGLTLRENTQQLKAVQEKLKILDQTFINSEDTLAFINDLELVADEHNVLQTINIPDIEVMDGIFTVPVSLTLHGGSKEIISFINALDAKPYYFIIDNLSIEIPELSNSATNVTLQATTYWK